MAGLWTDTVTDADGNYIETDQHETLPAGLYFLNGLPYFFKPGDKLNGSLIVPVERADK